MERVGIGENNVHYEEEDYSWWAMEYGVQISQDILCNVFFGDKIDIPEVDE